MASAIVHEPQGRHQSKKAAASGWIGSALEYYDFFIYATAASLIFPQIFFPSTDPKVAIIASLATYGVGYVARPIGAFVLGYWGDTHGRKTVLILCMFLMGFSTPCSRASIPSCSRRVIGSRRWRSPRISGRPSRPCCRRCSPLSHRLARPTSRSRSAPSPSRSRLSQRAPLGVPGRPTASTSMISAIRTRFPFPSWSTIGCVSRRSPRRPRPSREYIQRLRQRWRGPVPQPITSRQVRV